jgi:hypothetical protein
MKQKIVRVLNNVLFLLVAVFSVGYFAGIEVEKVSATATTAPTGFISQTYEDDDGDGVVDQVVIVINDGGESLSACTVTDDEVDDWEYTNGDIGGSLALSGHSCDLSIAAVTLKITGANESTTGHDTAAPTIAYKNGNANSIVNKHGGLSAVAAIEIADGAVPVMVSAVYKDTDDPEDGMVDRIDVTYSETIEGFVNGSVFEESEWSFSFDSSLYSLVINPTNSLILSTDVRIVVTSDLAISDVPDDITVVYAVATGTTGEIVDDASNRAVSAELLVKAEDDGVAPVMSSATYKVNSDGIVDEIVVTYSEDIETHSTFTKGEWSFFSNPYSLEIASGSFSSTDVQIIITDPKNKTINGTTIKYTAGTGITDGANCAITAELPVRAEGYIGLPDGGTEKLEQPNPNSGVTLYRIDGSPRVYVIKNKKKHWIQTPKEFNENGYNWGKVKIVSAEVLEGYPDAEDSTTELLRAVGSYKVYKIENGKRRWIKTAGEFNATGYKWKDIKDVSPETLASYQDIVSSGLIRATGSHKVYIIENGKKRWIKTAGEFNAAGHRWGDVEDVSVATLDSYSDLE